MLKNTMEWVVGTVVLVLVLSVMKYRQWRGIPTDFSD